MEEPPRGLWAQRTLARSLPCVLHRQPGVIGTAWTTGKYKKGYPDFLPSLHILLPAPATTVTSHPPCAQPQSDRTACDSPHPSSLSALVLCGLSLSVWTSNTTRALFGQKHRINSSDQMGIWQRFGGTKVMVVEGHRKGIFLSLSFTFILIEARSILKWRFKAPSL